MKVKLLAILIICSLLLLTGCSQKSAYEEMQEEYENSNMTMQQLNEEAQRLMQEHGITEEDFEDDNYVETGSSGSELTMIRCSGGNDPSYLIYLGKEKAFQKVTMGNGGITKTILTGTQSCAIAEPSEVPMQCVDLSPSQYSEHYMTYKQYTQEPMKTVLGLSCSNVPYDEEVFALE
jgi:hypothetical protein